MARKRNNYEYHLAPFFFSFCRVSVTSIAWRCRRGPCIPSLPEGVPDGGQGVVGALGILNAYGLIFLLHLPCMRMPIRKTTKAPSMRR